MLQSSLSAPFFPFLIYISGEALFSLTGRKCPSQAKVKYYKLYSTMISLYLNCSPLLQGMYFTPRFHILDLKDACKPWEDFFYFYWYENIVNLIWQSTPGVDTSGNAVLVVENLFSQCLLPIKFNQYKSEFVTITEMRGEMAQGRTENLISHDLKKRVDGEVAMFAIDSKLLRVIKMKVDCKDLQKALTVVRQ